MAGVLEALVTALETIPGIDFTGAFGITLILGLLIGYAIYLIASMIILSLALKFMNVENVEFSKLLSPIIIRDFISLGALFIPFGLGAIFAFIIWIGIIKYFFKIDWGHAVLVAIVAQLIPIAIIVVLFALGIISLLFFL